MKLEGKAKMLRIHFGEDDKWQNKALYEAIVIKCRELDIAGATVFRGIEGYGASTLIHKRHVLFSSDRPIMVTVIDTEEKVSKLIPALDVLPGQKMSPHAEIQEARATTLWKMASGGASIVIAPVEAAAMKLKMPVDEPAEAAVSHQRRPLPAGVSLLAQSASARCMP